MELFEKIKRKSDLMRKKAQDAVRSDEDDAFAPLKHPADKGEPGFLGKLIKFIVILSSGTYKAIIGTANLARKAVFLAMVFFAISMAWKYMGWKNAEVDAPQVSPVRTESPAKSNESFLDNLKASIGLSKEPIVPNQTEPAQGAATPDTGNLVESEDDRRARESKQGEKYVQLPVLYPLHAQKTTAPGQVTSRLEMRDVVELEKIKVDVKKTEAASKGQGESTSTGSRPNEDSGNGYAIPLIVAALAVGLFFLRKIIGRFIQNISAAPKK